MNYYMENHDKRSKYLLPKVREIVAIVPQLAIKKVAKHDSCLTIGLEMAKESLLTSAHLKRMNCSRAREAWAADSPSFVIAVTVAPLR